MLHGFLAVLATLGAWLLWSTLAELALALTAPLRGFLWRACVAAPAAWPLGAASALGAAAAVAAARLGSQAAGDGARAFSGIAFLAGTAVALLGLLYWRDALRARRGNRAV